MTRATGIAGVLATAFAIANLLYFSALRTWHQHWGATEAELSASLPGDELLPAPASQVTHAITIQATPEQVWPWIMQIGQDRSGFYSYTWAENLIGCDMPKVERIVPDWKPRTTGETVWFGTPRHFGGRGRMIAAVVRPQRSLAMVSVADWDSLHEEGSAKEVVWSFTLQKTDAEETRLIARLRSGPPKSAGQHAAVLLFWEPAHFFMERKMLLTIKALSERTHGIRTGELGQMAPPYAGVLHAPEPSAAMSTVAESR
jgi:hypothetical protein